MREGEVFRVKSRHHFDYVLIVKLETSCKFSEYIYLELRSRFEARKLNSTDYNKY